jgi:hypothetical protein
VVHRIGRAWPLGALGAGHAHVEGTVLLKRKTPFGPVELQRGDAEVERDPIHAAAHAAAHPAAWPHGAGFEEPVHVAEAALDQAEPPGIAFGQDLGAGDGFGVAVDGPDGALGRVQEGAAIAAGAEGAVDVDGALARR